MPTDYKELLNLETIPKHIAIIMDGNGRWAKQKGRNRIFGHNAGVKAVRNTVETCADLGVNYLTLYAFSTENWGRPRSEVSALMELLIRTLRSEIKELNKNNIRLQAIGHVEQLPKRCRLELEQGKNLTHHNERMTLNLALSYSGKWELTKAMQAIAKKVENNELRSENINEQIIAQHLETYNMPDPELLIRTSGEQRISNFLLWQLAYSEFYFTDIFWPDFNEQELYKAIYTYQQRERRFGKLELKSN